MRSCSHRTHTAIPESQALEMKQDRLIGELRKFHGRDGELTALVRENIKKVIYVYY